MDKYQNDILCFTREREVPFTNNQAERDIRMAKVQKKISGCFQSLSGAQTFARIRGCLSTPYEKRRLSLFPLTVMSLINCK